MHVEAPPPAPEPPSEPDPLPELSFDLDGLDDEEPIEPKLSPNIDALFGSDDEDDDEDDMDDLDAVSIEEEPDPGAITPREDPDLSQDDLDSLFDEDDATDGISSMVEGTDEEGIDELDDIPDPDPLPKSLTGNLDNDDIDIDDDDEEEDEAPKSRRGRKAKSRAKDKKGGKGLIIALAIIVLLLGGLGSGLVFLRGLVMEFVPAMGMVYDMVGLGMTLGEGLEIRNVSSERGTSEGVDFLMLSGSITSTVEGPMPVPLIKALLIDAEGEIIQSVIQEPGATELPGGESLGFAVKIEEPSPLARRLEVTFEPRPEPAG